MRVLELNRMPPMLLPDIPVEQFDNRTLGIMQVGYQPLNVIERAWVPLPGSGLMATEDIRVLYPWSTPFISCVPVGEYEMVLRESPSKGKRWHFFNPDKGIYLEKEDRPDQVGDKHPITRYSCMFHPANFWYDIEGCAGMGMGLTNFGSERPPLKQQKGWGVTSSRNATSILETYLGDGPARLIIR